MSVQKKPICLECRWLVWQGFLGHCVNTLMDNSLLDEVNELEEAKLAGKSKKELAVIEQQQEIRFDKSLANKFLAIPYIVWRRKGKIKYYEYAPRTIEDCPFQFRKNIINIQILKEK